MMLGSKPAWVEADIGASDQSFGTYPRESLAQWHRRNGLGD